MTLSLDMLRHGVTDGGPGFQPLHGLVRHFFTQAVANLTDQFQRAILCFVQCVHEHHLEKSAEFLRFHHTTNFGWLDDLGLDG